MNVNENFDILYNKWRSDLLWRRFSWVVIEAVARQLDDCDAIHKHLLLLEKRDRRAAKRALS